MKVLWLKVGTNASNPVCNKVVKTGWRRKGKRLTLEEGHDAGDSERDPGSVGLEGRAIREGITGDALGLQRLHKPNVAGEGGRAVGK
jgi:hypothetical protein